MKTTRTKIVVTFLVIGLCTTAYADDYDLVINGGRVMDPETKLDAVRNVGIKDGTIASITDQDIVGNVITSYSIHYTKLYERGI